MACRSSAAARLITARTAVSMVPITSYNVISAPSQWVKWIISGAAMPGNGSLVPPEKPATSCGNTGPQIEHVVVLGRQAIERDRNVLVHTARQSVPAISRAGITPSRAYMAGSSHR